MPESAKKLGIIFKRSTQDRAKKTLENLLQTAQELIESGDPDLFTSRSLAKKSGYALGTLSKHLQKIDGVFLWAIIEGRNKNIESLRKIIDEFNPQHPVHILLEQLTDKAIHEIQRVNPKVIRFFQSRAVKRTDAPWDMNKFTDALVPSWRRAIERDQTGTFRHMSEEEVKWSLRTALVFIEHPFVELNPLSGTTDHRTIAIECLTRLFRK